jgi:hypothetical protein
MNQFQLFMILFLIAAISYWFKEILVIAVVTLFYYGLFKFYCLTIPKQAFVFIENKNPP